MAAPQGLGEQNRSGPWALVPATGCCHSRRVSTSTKPPDGYTWQQGTPPNGTIPPIQTPPPVEEPPLTLAWLDYCHRHPEVTSTPDQAAFAGTQTLAQPPLTPDEHLLVSLFRRRTTEAPIRAFLGQWFTADARRPIPAPRVDVHPARVMSYSNIAVVVLMGLATGTVLRTLFELLTTAERYYDDWDQWTLTLAIIWALALAGFVVWYARPARPVPVVAAGVSAAIGLVVAWVYPFPFEAEPYYTGTPATFSLTMMHLPIVMVVVWGGIYVGRRWRDARQWLDFIQLGGEALIYYALIAVGGGILLALTTGLFYLMDVDISKVIEWVLPICAVAASFLAGWLAGIYRSVSSAMTAIMAAVFTPLATVMVVIFAIAALTQGNLAVVDRDFLIMMDALLALVFALVIYRAAARDRQTSPTLLDWLQFVLVAATLLVDVLALWAMVARIAEFGTSPNKVAALGENLVLLVNLVGTAWFYQGFLRTRWGFDRLVKWQGAYLAVFGAWALVVVVAFPPIFGYL